jgi:glyoxalase family protein
MTALTGIHHVTAIAADAQRNVDFYSGILGLRLVKKTVNFDDPGSYHLYYVTAWGRLGLWSHSSSGRERRMVNAGRVSR